MWETFVSVFMNFTIDFIFKLCYNISVLRKGVYLIMSEAVVFVVVVDFEDFEAIQGVFFNKDDAEKFAVEESKDHPYRIETWTVE